MIDSPQARIERPRKTSVQHAVWATPTFVNAPLRPTQQFLIALTLLWTAAFGFVVSSARAHELDIDRLSIRLQSNSQEFAGQLLLDPEMTRGADGTALPEADVEKHQARLLAFVEAHVIFRSGDTIIKPSYEVRELYVKGGAVPGDSVIYRALLPQSWRELSVQLSEPFKQLGVTTTVDMGEKPTILLGPGAPLVVHQSTPANLEKAPSESAPLDSREPSMISRSIDHIWTGVIHIIPRGWDHILFVVALTLGSFGKWRRLVLELSAFTVAHTMTLALGALELVRIPPEIVEPLIAFSISAVALEHLIDVKKSGLRFALVGFFGLLHGLGFAGVLLELGLSNSSFLLFLVSFNVGVELGQIVVVAFTIVLLWLLARWSTKREIATKILAMGIAAAGLILGIVRLAA